MEGSRSSTSVHSSSRDDSDVETAPSFNLSEISTANSFDYDELIDLEGSKRSRREAKKLQERLDLVAMLEKAKCEEAAAHKEYSSAKEELEAAKEKLEAAEQELRSAKKMLQQYEEKELEILLEKMDKLLEKVEGRDTHDEVNVEDGKPFEELPAAYGQDMDNDLTQDNVLPAEARTYIAVRPVSDALMPGARPVRSFSGAESVTQSESDTSNNRDTYEPDYSFPAITDSAALTPPDQTRLSYDSEYGISVTASQESMTDHVEAGEWTTVPAGVIVSFGKEKHGIEMDLGICMSLNAVGGPLVLSTLTVTENR